MNSPRLEHPVLLGRDLEASLIHASSHEVMPGFVIPAGSIVVRENHAAEFDDDKPSANFSAAERREMADILTNGPTQTVRLYHEDGAGFGRYKVKTAEFRAAVSGPADSRANPQPTI